MNFAPLVSCERGGMPESYHSGMVAVADGTGRIIYSAGDPKIVTFPRSSLKFIQTIPLYESGAYESLGLTPRHLALACASHDAEEIHTSLVKQWLESIGLDDSALKCGPDYPGDRTARESMIRGGMAPSRICHNCSGKHSGFLSVCRHMGLSQDTYNDPASRVQSIFMENLSLLAGNLPKESIKQGIDGCTLPAPALSLKDMAVAMGRFASPTGLASSKQKAIEAITDAVNSHPELVSSSRNGAVKVMKKIKEKVIIKVGAEGFFVGAVPGKGLGFALKIADGAERAALPAAVHTLHLIGAISDDEYQSLEDVHSPIIKNSAGTAVGLLKPVFSLEKHI